MTGRTSFMLSLFALAAWALLAIAATPAARAANFQDVIERVQPAIVKIYGVGGFRGLEPYQTGMLVSADGHILTVWSHALDIDDINVTLDDGRRFVAKKLGVDPRLELAVLKIEADDLPCFDLAKAASASAGARVLAFTNLYNVAVGNEDASVQLGNVAVLTHLEARRGVFETTYKGPVYILDCITNNPGAAGGALTDREGRLVGMIGKELRNALDHTWINYAIPIDQLAGTVADISAGRFQGAEDEAPTARPTNAHQLELLGVALVPDVLERTPPFVDQVRMRSAAAAAGLRPDDLVIFVDGRLVQSCKELVVELGMIDRIDPVKITVLRDQELVDFTLTAPPETP